MTTLDNYKVFNTNSFEDIKNYTFCIKGTNLKKESKLFLKDLLELSGMEVSVNILKAQEEIPFFHKHKQNEELYIVIKGEVMFIVDEEIINLKEGSFLKIKPDGARYYKNNSLTKELVLIVIQAKENSLGSKTIEDGYFVD